MQDLGYETHNSILNLGSLVIFGTFYCLKVFLYFLGRTIEFISCKKIKIRYLDVWKHSLFYGEILSIILEAYMEWLISGYMNNIAPLDDKDGEVLGDFIGIACTVIALVVIPGILYFIWK